jgi:hypothetical protein
VRLVPAIAASLLLLTACGGGDGDAPDRAAQLLANLPSCDRVPLDESAEIAADVDGLYLPETARVTSVTEQGPLTTVSGTIRMSPLEIRHQYESRHDVDLLRVEDEVFEAEILMRADGHRMYLMASALCADGSALTAIVGPDSDEAGLPEFQSDLP